MDNDITRLRRAMVRGGEAVSLSLSLSVATSRFACWLLLLTSLLLYVCTVGVFSCVLKDDDLLREQEEFLRQPRRSEVAAARIRRVETSSTSSLSQRGGTVSVQDAAASSDNDEEDVVELDEFPHEILPSIPPSAVAKVARASVPSAAVDADEAFEVHEQRSFVPHVISSIVEQEFDASDANLYRAPQIGTSSKTGFPSVNHGDISGASVSGSTATGKPRSLFAQRLAASRAAASAVSPPEEDISPPSNGSSQRQYTGTSRFGRGVLPDSDRDAVHAENIQRLDEMPVAEIEAMQAQLRKSLSPAILAMLESKSKSTINRGAVRESVVDDDGDYLNLAASSGSPGGGSPDGVLSEYQKMEWMQPLTDEEKNTATLAAQHKPIWEVFRAGFDGDWADCKAPTHDGLHHHGDDPSSSGYTIRELLHLVRSRVPSQRILCLNILANVLRRAHMNQFASGGAELAQGILDLFLDQRGPLLARLALDDSPNHSAIVAAVGCIHALLCPYEDTISSMHDSGTNGDCASSRMAYECLFHGEVVVETGATKAQVLDAPLSHTQAELDHIVEAKRADSQAQNDPEQPDPSAMCSSDILRAFVRLDILPRLRYVLEYVGPAAQSPVLIANVLDILSTISTHSKAMAGFVARTPHLVDALLNSKLWSSKPPPQLFRLLRVLCAANEKTAMMLSTDDRLLDMLIRHVSVAASAFDMQSRTVSIRDLVRSTAMDDSKQSSVDTSVMWSRATEAAALWRVLISQSHNLDSFLQVSQILPSVFAAVQPLVEEYSSSDGLLSAIVTFVRSVFEVAAAALSCAGRLFCDAHRRLGAAQPRPQRLQGDRPRRRRKNTRKPAVQSAPSSASSGK